MKSTRYRSECGVLRFTAWCVSVCLAPVSSLWAQAVLTRSYDNSRSGANTLEKNLSPAIVASVKKLRELALDRGDDPRIEAQPLYVSTRYGEKREKWGTPFFFTAYASQRGSY